MVLLHKYCLMPGPVYRKVTGDIFLFSIVFQGYLITGGPAGTGLIFATPPLSFGI